MKKIKSIILTVLLLAVVQAFTACGGGSDTSDTLRIGATAVPHSEILGQIVPVLEEQGITVEIVVFDDFILPNNALDAGDIDVNFFQHVPFLDNFNYNHSTDLVPVFGVHFEPLRLYAGRLYSLDNIPSGATIAIPDDPTNEARALMLLESLGLIALEPGLALAASASTGIAQNPHNLDIQTHTAQILPHALPDVDFAIINGNIALEGGVFYRAIEGAGEEPDSPAAQRFTNYVVVRRGYENNSAVQALIEALNTQQIRDFIYNQYHGRVVPTF